MATQPIDVLVIGAGPVGLTTAIELTRRGVPCRVVDRRPTPRPGSRACTVWQRTLETFDLMGVPVGDYIASGSRYVHRTYHLAGFPSITHDMTEPGSAHPNPIIIAQTDTERMLTEHLAGLGVIPERGLKAVALQQDPDGVTVTLHDLDGGERTVRAGYVVAAQGPHSTVRDQTGIEWIGKRFPGTQLLQVDARLHGELPGDPAHCHLFMNHLGSLGTAPFPDGRLRLYAGVPDLDPDRSGDPDPEQVLAAVRLVTGLPELTMSDARFNWRVRLHNSIAASYRAGRCFLAGDSAHTTMPVTAQGMNTGIQDAFNLAWKLAEVVKGAAGETLLDSYDAERRPIAVGLLQRTERAYWGGVGQLPDWPDLYEKLHRIGSIHTGIPLSYADGPLAEDRLGGEGVQAGDRVPDGPLGTNRLFRALGGGSWTLLALPADPADPASVEKAARAVAESGVGGHVVRQQDDATRRALGAEHGGLFLARPDGYLGYRGPVDDTSALRGYLARVAA